MPRVPVNAVDIVATSVREIAQTGIENIDMGQYFYKKNEIQKMMSDAEFHLYYRKQIEYSINTGFALFYKDSDASKMAQAYMTAEMTRRLNNHPTLTSKLIPKWPPGCRLVTCLLFDTHNHSSY